MTAAPPPEETEPTIVVGSRPRAGGLIHVLALDGKTGRLRRSAPPVAAEKPSFVAVHPTGRWLYAVSETGREANESGRVAAYAFAPSGDITPINEVSSGGAAPCFLAVSRDGRHLFVANYWGGSAAVFRLEPDGSIGAATALLRHAGGSRDPGRDPGPHPHWIALDRPGTACFVVDLGLDRVLRYPFDTGSGSIDARPSASVDLPDGFGPRHCAQDASGRLHVVGEFGSAIATLAPDQEGGSPCRLGLVPTVPGGFSGENAPAEIALDPAERYLYVSNRGHDSIAWFVHDPGSGRLTPRGAVPSGGRGPRHFAIEPSGRFLIVANQLSDHVAVFALDPDSGEPLPTGQGFAVVAPTCIRPVRIPAAARPTMDPTCMC